MLSPRDPSGRGISDEDFVVAEDDYWNTSNIEAFDFETDAQLFGVSKSNTSRLTQQVLAGFDSKDQASGSDTPTASLRQKATVPLESIVSQKIIDKIIMAETLEDPLPCVRDSKDELRMLRTRVQEMWTAPAVDVTIKRIMLFQPHILDPYKSLEQKESLLKAAISLGDGNTIIKVILFLRNTLTTNNFQKVLTKNPSAVSHYSQYLATRNENAQLTDILEMLGRTRESAMVQLSLCIQSSSPERQLKGLRKIYTSHFAQGNSRERDIVANYISLLEWQQAVGVQDKENLCGKSVKESLVHACRFHWGDVRNAHTSPMALYKGHKVTDSMFQWVALSVLCEKQAWSDIDSFFITKNWLGSKVNSAIPIDRIISMLQSHNAPEEEIKRYRAYADNAKVKRVLDRHLGVSSERK